MGLAVTITGTRSVEEVTSTQLQLRFGDYLRPFATAEAHFYLGGAIGIDTAALEWLAKETNAALTVAVPCAVADQPAKAADAIGRWSTAGRLSGVVELSADRLGAEAYHARNRWMVDRSEFVVGFPRGTDPSSGTWYTLNYAADQGKPQLVIPL
ncbi:hypothetical protein D5S17_18535 [Pseudonocardiaceae bacterium YIM PH 21723]|nr:hypothetical protein D5S17_18535 [Pseudonocardiaceae bacterium YIM PH 21723]